MTLTPPRPSVGGSKNAVASEITRMVSRVTRDYAGRGPDKAYSYVTEGVVTVVMHDTLTKTELQLAGDGAGDTVIALRRAVQQAIRRELVQGVQDIMGRTVTGFFSDHQLHPDIAIEAFVLGPPLGEGASSDAAMSAT